MPHIIIATRYLTGFTKMKIIQSIFFGILAAAGALVLELALMTIFNQQEINRFDNINLFLAITIFIEEIFKYLIIYKIALGLNSKKSIIFSSLFVGLGFSLAEGSLGVLKGFVSPDFINLGIIGAFALHIATAGLMGCFFSEAKRSGMYFFSKVIAIAFLIHLSYNALVIYNVNYQITYGCLILLLAAMAGWVYLTIKNEAAKP